LCRCCVERSSARLTFVRHMVARSGSCVHGGRAPACRFSRIDSRSPMYLAQARCSWMSMSGNKGFWSPLGGVTGTKLPPCPGSFLAAMPERVAGDVCYQRPLKS
jgi:hypothetical protein